MNEYDPEFQKINGFFKELKDLRESMNIMDFFFHPQVVHLNRLFSGDTSEIHEQRVFEISMVMKGRICYNLEGREILLQKGDLVIIPPGMKHYWQIPEKDTDIFNFMVNISKHGDGARRDFYTLNDSLKNHNYHIKNFTTFEKDIREIISEALEQKAACKDKVLLLMKTAFIELLRILLPEPLSNSSASKLPPLRGDKEKDIVEIIYYYIQDNISRLISLKEISRHVGLSIGYLNLLFKKETGTSINQAIINRRLDWACRYLKQSDRQIKDIATLVGYKDPNYFYLQFRKKYKKTPSEYRSGLKTS